MRLAELFPGNIVVKEFTPTLRNLGSSGKSFWVVDKGKHLYQELDQHDDQTTPSTPSRRLTLKHSSFGKY
jgi:hypothetical protein